MDTSKDNENGASDQEGKRSPGQIDPTPPRALDGREADPRLRDALDFVNRDLERIDRDMEEMDNAIARIRQTQSGSAPQLMGGGREDLRRRASLQSSQLANPSGAGSDEQGPGGRPLSSSSRSDGTRKRGRPKGSTSGSGSYKKTSVPKPWTNKEHDLFLEGVEKYGRGRWTEIAKNVLKTRTAAQIASHAQKHFGREKAEDDDEGPPRARGNKNEDNDNDNDNTIEKRPGDDNGEDRGQDEP